jgi:hypothetical protein
MEENINVFTYRTASHYQMHTKQCNIGAHSRTVQTLNGILAHTVGLDPFLDDFTTNCKAIHHSLISNSSCI